MPIKGSSYKNEICHHLLTLTSLHTNPFAVIILPWNIKRVILKNITVKFLKGKKYLGCYSLQITGIKPCATLQSTI